jgi:hypothetical protein
VRPYLEKKSQKLADGVAQGVGLEFKPQYQKKKSTSLLLERLPSRMLARMRGKSNRHTLLVGMQASTTIMENNMEAS